MFAFPLNIMFLSLARVTVMLLSSMSVLLNMPELPNRDRSEPNTHGVFFIFIF